MLLAMPGLKPGNSLKMWLWLYREESGSCSPRLITTRPFSSYTTSLCDALPADTEHPVTEFNTLAVMRVTVSF
jgi:hypothetical protein